MEEGFGDQNSPMELKEITPYSSISGLGWKSPIDRGGFIEDGKMDRERGCHRA